ncbi:MAG: DHHA1 domain-containing protein [Isosphaeraceae bacterium]
MTADFNPEPTFVRQQRSERLLATLAPFSHVVIVSHVNPDPDALASMLGLKALIDHCQPGKSVTLTMDGMIARAENCEMVRLVPIPLVPVESVPVDARTAVIMVDSQPHTGRRASEDAVPLVVIDHHETGGTLAGVAFRDIRPNMGATCTIVTGYLLERKVPISPPLTTALLYGIESETSGYPREASSLDDGALVWLFPRADKDLLARIRNPKLPYSHFATFHHALANAFLYHDVVVSWCGPVTQPDIIAEIADFFVRFDRVHWALSIGLFENVLKLSVRVSQLGGHSGEVLRDVVDGLGTAGGHDKRAGGAVPLTDPTPASIDASLTTIRRRLLARLGVDENLGRRLLEDSPVIPAP